MVKILRNDSRRRSERRWLQNIHICKSTSTCSTKKKISGSTNPRVSADESFNFWSILRAVVFTKYFCRETQIINNNPVNRTSISVKNRFNIRLCFYPTRFLPKKIFAIAIRIATLRVSCTGKQSCSWYRFLNVFFEGLALTKQITP